jgi:signal transduction histidine kinase
VSNASKFTPDGSIRVRAAACEDGATAARLVRVEVSDTGRGIAPAIAERLGEAFALNSGVVGESYVKGSGLGLAICRGIVSAHGGTTSVASTPGKGTTVTVLLRADLPGPVADGPGAGDTIRKEAA